MMHRWRKYVALIVLVCGIGLMLSGCWSKKDLNELAIVVAVGLDLVEGEGGQEEIGFTIQIVRPEIILARQQGSSEKAFWVQFASGETLYDAVRDMLSQVNGTPYYSHMQIILIGERLARSKGLPYVVDLVERSYQSNRLADWIVVKGGTAREMLQMEAESLDIPALYLVNVLQNSIRTTSVRRIKFIHALQDLNSDGKNVVIGIANLENTLARAKSSENVKVGDTGTQSLMEFKKSFDLPKIKLNDIALEGAAAFKEGLLVGWLNEKETAGFRLATGDAKSGTITVENPEEKGKKVTIVLEKSSSELDVTFKGDKPFLMIEVKQEGFIGEMQGSTSSRKILHDVEDAVNREVVSWIENALNKAQDMESDIFGFGNVIHRKHLEQWKKLRESWDMVFATLPVEIKVSTKIRRTGLLEKPSEAR